MTTPNAPLFQDPCILWLLWLYYTFGPSDISEWNRAQLAWKYQLTRAQVQVAELIAYGLSNDQIAERLDLAEVNSVKKRIDKIFDKMGVRDRVLVGVITTSFGLGPPHGSLPEPKA